MFKPIFLQQLSARALPGTLLNAAFVSLFNHGMREQALLRRLKEIEGKHVCVRVTDLQWTLEVTVGEKYLQMTRKGEAAHVTISASLADLCRLAARREDPDTLFFERRLSIEGETQTGLTVKNLLDTLEWDWKIHLQAVLPAPLANLAIHVGHRLQASQRL